LAEEIVRIFDWLALISVGLMSVTIPTYALSVSFLGRESRRTKLELERRKEELEKRTKELANAVRSEPGLSALKKEIAKYDEDIKRIESRLGSMSVRSAFVIPFVFFSGALVSTAFGLVRFVGTTLLALPSDPSAGLIWAGLAVVLLIGGMLWLGTTLYRINEAALNPETLSSFRMSFDTGATAEKFSAGEQKTIQLAVHNRGKEMAEDVQVQVYFPDEFAVPGSERQGSSPGTTYPGRQTIQDEFDKLHEDVMRTIQVDNVRMPNAAG
jgi:ABC-type multidrug transport system fused ATPase/permease subunit